MFTNVMIVGRLGESIDEFTRTIEIDHLDEVSAKLYAEKIPVQYWSKTSSCSLMKLKSGSMVAARGRISNDKDLGLVVIVEILSLMFNGKYQVL